jgi:hypothetical protein
MANGDNVLADTRRPYRRPELHGYGAMRAITKGGAGGSAEVKGEGKRP